MYKVGDLVACWEGVYQITELKIKRPHNMKSLSNWVMAKRIAHIDGPLHIQEIGDETMIWYVDLVRFDNDYINKQQMIIARKYIRDLGNLENVRGLCG